jgi:hypothetical protein
MQRLAETSGRVRRDPLLMIQLLLLLLLAFCIYRGYFDAGPATIAGALLLIIWQIRPKWFEAAARGVGRLARRPLLPIALVTGLSFGVAFGVSLSRGLPEPAINDEFSYLLAADTFLHGRLGNPTHPMWIHLETLQVIFQPTYASKYPPAQGLVLAAGRLVGGRAIVGVWLSTALACGLLCWCSMAWLGQRWGFLGGLLAAVHPLVLEWSQNYWGGAVAMGGGALLLGAFRRLARRPNAGDAWLLGTGMAIVAFSRPFEGAVLSVLVLAALLFLTLRKRVPLGRLLRSVGLPVIVMGGLIVIGWWYLNLRVTGNPLQMPVILHEKTYAITKPFVWQAPYPEPAYRHPSMRDTEAMWMLPVYLAQRKSFAGFYSAAIDKLALYSNAAFQGCGAVFLIALCLARRDRFVGLALAMLILFSVVLLAATWSQPHYAAPAAAIVLVLSLKTLKRLNRYTAVGLPIGRTFTRVCMTLFVASMLTTDLEQKPVGANSWSVERARILAALQLEPGKHLVLVRYTDHNFPEEWIHNDADIDAAKVVWAHDMGREQNLELLEYFKDRTIWLLEPDTRKAGKPEVVLYSEEVAQNVVAN